MQVMAARWGNLKKRWRLDPEGFGALHSPIARPAMKAPKNGKQCLDSRPSPLSVAAVPHPKSPASAEPAAF